MKSLDYDALFAEGLQWVVNNKHFTHRHICDNEQTHINYSQLEAHFWHTTWVDHNPYGTHLALITRRLLAEKYKCASVLRFSPWKICRDLNHNATPWGYWSTKYHWTCTSVTHKEIFTWLIVCNSVTVSLPKEMVYLVCYWICTKQ